MRVLPVRPTWSAVCWAISVAACLLLSAGCTQNSSGSVGLRTASMTTPDDDGRLPSDSAFYLRFDPP
jgi:hypothetical protein